MTATIKAPTPNAYTRIISVGAYRPSRIVDNAEICTRIDSTDEWILERSGIRERRYAAPDESVIDMAVNAAKVALERAGIDPTELGLLLVASCTYPYLTPSAATQIAVRIGATGIPATDISSACAGFCYGVGMASDIIRSGNAKYAMVIGAEKLTDWFDPADRSLAFLFGDGAGAVVIGPSDTPGIGPTAWGSDGTQTEALGIAPSFLDQRNDPINNVPMLYMQGQTVFRWAVTEMARVAEEALAAAGITSADLSAFIPHQANNRITDALVRSLKMPESVVVARDVIMTGNTSAASIPLALSRMVEEGDVPSGGLALIIGFGAGLAYAAQVITLP
ncbi:MAG: ketoacyl-ACP synthase III [Candidatus Nanopelagicales bacterium]|nr:ketoacyl-ACP synthase III [Candidatus Nanopelagicales bacterium]